MRRARRWTRASSQVRGTPAEGPGGAAPYPSHPTTRPSLRRGAFCCLDPQTANPVRFSLPQTGDIRNLYLPGVIKVGYILSECSHARLFVSGRTHISVDQPSPVSPSAATQRW
jgi:hypothetical protein